ncbi:MAG TPA: UGSC family (seleno)protein, partial [Dehalococcoidia bacterium]|nr:UGSC family (seleno)protein [Dehalococcoidia bacterium]
MRSTTRMAGLPQAAFAFVPQPVMGKPAHELRAYVDGLDPITGRPVMQEVIEGLTGLLNGHLAPEAERNTPRLVEPDTEDNLRALFEANHWTDFLP